MNWTNRPVKDNLNSATKLSHQVTTVFFLAITKWRKESNKEQPEERKAKAVVMVGTVKTC
jgi:hypothetical protein